MRDRRRAARQTAGWRATCLIDEPELGTKEWRECWVLDLSTNGLALTMLHRNPSEMLGRSILVEFPAMSQWVSVRLEGRINNIEEMAPELVRVGIEFEELSKEEQAVATVLGVMTEVVDPGAPLHIVART
jgi:PilZ domain